MRVPHTPLWNIWIPIIIAVVTFVGAGIFIYNTCNPPWRWWGGCGLGVSAFAALTFKLILAVIYKQEDEEGPTEG